MLKPFLSIICLYCLVIFSSCQKELDPIDATGTDSTGIDTTGIDTTGTDTATAPLSDTYFPLTKNSYWIYADSGYANSDVTETVMGEQVVQNGITFEKVHVKSALQDDDSYVGIKDHFYYIQDEAAGYTVTMQLLNDAKAVGGTWEYDMGVINNVPTKGTGKILQKDIAFTVQGKTFQHVIETEYVMTYNFAGTQLNLATYHYWFAKGVGLIKNESLLTDLTGQLVISSKLELKSYSIK